MKSKEQNKNSIHVKYTKLGREDSESFLDNIKELLIQEEVAEIGDFIVNYLETSHLFKVNDQNIYLKFIQQSNKVERYGYYNGSYRLKDAMYYDEELFLEIIGFIIRNIIMLEIIINLLIEFTEKHTVNSIEVLKDLFFDGSMIQLYGDEAVSIMLDGNILHVKNYNLIEGSWEESDEFSLTLNNLDEFLSLYVSHDLLTINPN